MSDGRRFLSRAQGEGNRLCLLLFFLAGSLLAWFEPGMAERLDRLPTLLPACLLLPALLSGCVFGGFLIPAVTLLYGVFSMHALAGAGPAALQSPEFWRAAVGPLLLLTPLLFLLCEAGMRLADQAAAVLSSGTAAERDAVFRRQALHLLGVIAALLFRFWPE